MVSFGNTGRALAAAAGCALLLGAPASAQTAPTPELFGLWKRVCADNGGIYARTITAPEVQGWSRIPFPIPIPSKDAKLNKKTIRAKALGGGGFGMFFAGEGELKSAVRPAPFQMCAVAFKPGEFADVLRQAQAWAGQPAVAGEDGMRSFRHHLSADGRRTPLEAGKLRELASKLGPGTVISVDVAPSQGAAVISYSTIKL
ncbi:MAG: hypothetical protein KY449_00330 [Proteobacteria bacterium]|nr:hypothetical protein [Pseudomonadota bacterium]